MRDGSRTLTADEGSLNQLGKFMECCKFLIIAIASVTSSMSIKHKQRLHGAAVWVWTRSF